VRRVDEDAPSLFKDGHGLVVACHKWIHGFTLSLIDNDCQYDAVLGLLLNNVDGRW
jgi:hypothetical protein